ncbi:MAG: hypothetical protein H6646_00320 [Anaerolineales bacterium]|nr:hypothetical protein [Anaerolineales bacterium]
MQRKPGPYQLLWIAGLVMFWAVLFAPVLSAAGMATPTAPDLPPGWSVAVRRLPPLLREHDRPQPSAWTAPIIRIWPTAVTLSIICSTWAPAGSARP